MAILKLIYNTAQSNEVTSGIGDMVAGLYDEFAFIKFMWHISPTPSIEPVFTFSNFLGLVVLAASVIGFAWMSRANYHHTRLLEAKRKAEDQQLLMTLKIIKNKFLKKLKGALSNVPSDVK